MQLKNTILLAAVVLTTAFGSSLKAQPTCDRLWATENELVAEHAGTVPVTMNDTKGILMPRWSPSGDRIAYAHRLYVNDPSALVIVDNAGRRVQSLQLPADSPVNAVQQLNWRDENHVFIEGHVNPSTTVYLEWDATTGQLVAEKAGSWFAVSPDGRFVAQQAHVPHGAPPPYDSAVLLVNDQRVYPVAGDESYHRFTGGLVWSPSGQLATIDLVGDVTEVVVLTADVSRITRVPLAGVTGARALSWTGGGAVNIQTDRGETWQADVPAGKVHRGQTTARSSETTQTPQEIQRRLHGVPAHAEDSRCRTRAVQ